MVNPGDTRSFDQLKRIFYAFYNLSKDPNPKYRFLSDFHKISPTQFYFENLYGKLKLGTLSDTYLKNNPVFVGVYYKDKEQPGHFCVIVGYEGEKSVNYNGMDYSFQLYKADDPAFGNVKVCVPLGSLKQNADLFRGVCSYASGLDINPKTNDYFAYHPIYPDSCVG